jgi:hypothetical protein
MPYQLEQRATRGEYQSLSRSFLIRMGVPVRMELQIGLTFHVADPREKEKTKAKTGRIA